MDALMAALVAAGAAQVGDRAAWLTAILADRFGRPALVLLAAALALAAASGIAAAGGAIVAPLLASNARSLFLAVALVLQGGGALFPVSPPERLDGWRLGAFGTAACGLFVVVFADGVQFVVAALAARSSAPWLAAVGATIGSLAALGPAALLGEKAWTGAPLASVRRAVGVVFLLVGVIIGLGALRLI